VNTLSMKVTKSMMVKTNFNNNDEEFHKHGTSTIGIVQET
jgi:hypothetical protein